MGRFNIVDRGRITAVILLILVILSSIAVDEANAAETNLAASPNNADERADFIEAGQNDINVTVDKQSIAVSDYERGSPESIVVSVTGTDDHGPGAENGTLKNATISVSGVGVSAERYTDSGHQNITFDIKPEQNGTIEVEVTAFGNSSHEKYDDNISLGTETVAINAQGDKVRNLTPRSITKDETVRFSVEITDSTDTFRNTRTVWLYPNASGQRYGSAFNVTLDGSTFESGLLAINGSAEEIQAYDGSTPNRQGNLIASESYTVNFGTYEFDDIDLNATGEIRMHVRQNDGSTSVYIEDAITVGGADVYNITTGTDRFLAGHNQTLNVTLIENGQRLNGSELAAINFSVTQAGVHVNVTTIRPINSTAEYDGVDLLRTSINANESATAAVNITARSDGGDKESTRSFNVTQPEITAALGADSLTEGLRTSDVTIQVNDPRDGSVIRDARIRFGAENSSFEIDSSAVIADGDTVIYKTDQTGTLTTDIAVFESPNRSGPVGLNVSTNTEGPAFFGEKSIPVGTMTFVDPPAELDIETAYDILFELRDANGRKIDLRNVGLRSADGGLAGENQTEPADEGFVNFAFTTGDVGTIQLRVKSSYARAGSSIVVHEIQVLEHVRLNLTSDRTRVEEGDAVNLTLRRGDFNRETSGTLTIENETDDQIDQVAISGSLDYTFDSVGEFTITASKPANPAVGKTFRNDSVAISVGSSTEGDGTVTFEDQIVPNGTTNVTVANVSANVDFYVNLTDPTGSILNTTGTFLKNRTNLTIKLDKPLTNNQTLTASVLDAWDDDELANASASISVREEQQRLPFVLGPNSPPIDLNRDGLVEDINGNGEFDLLDVQVLFNYRESDPVQNNPTFFDFNGDGRFSIADVQRLYWMLRQQ